MTIWPHGRCGKPTPAATTGRTLCHLHHSTATSGFAITPTWASLVSEGGIDELSRGVYRRTDAPETAHADLPAVCARAPRAVVFGESALALHELIDDIPSAVHIAVPRGSRRPTISYPPTVVAQSSTRCATADASARLSLCPRSAATYAATDMAKSVNSSTCPRIGSTVRRPPRRRGGARLMVNPARDTTAGRVYNDLRNPAGVAGGGPGLAVTAQDLWCISESLGWVDPAGRLPPGGPVTPSRAASPPPRSTRPRVSPHPPGRIVARSRCR